MAARWLRARQTKYAAYAFVYVVAVIAAIVVANILANRYNKSLDTTSNKRYSLSPQTAKIVKGLKQNATITYFNQSTRFNEGKDLLDEYSNLSPRVHVVYVDPDKDPELAREDGIRDFGTAVVQIGEKKDTAKSMTEEGISGSFIRDLKGNTRTVCFVTGSGEHQVSDTERDGLSQFSDLLGKEKNIRPRRSIYCRRPRFLTNAPHSWLPGRRAIICSPRSMPSRRMLRAEGGLYSCLTRRFRWEVRRSPKTMRLRICSKAGA